MLVNLSAYRNRKVVAVVRELLELAEKGEAVGIAFVVKLKRSGHHAGIEGDYRTDPDQALPAAVRLKQAIMDNQAEERQGVGS